MDDIKIYLKGTQPFSLVVKYYSTAFFALKEKETTHELFELFSKQNELLPDLQELVFYSMQTLMGEGFSSLLPTPFHVMGPRNNYKSRK